MGSDDHNAGVPRWIEEYDPDPHPANVYEMWEQDAVENVHKWGLQDVETLLLAMQEELGELSQAHLEAEHEDGDADRVGAELDDLVPLCIQLRWRLGADE